MFTAQQAKDTTNAVRSQALGQFSDAFSATIDAAIEAAAQNGDDTATVPMSSVPSVDAKAHVDFESAIDSVVGVYMVNGYNVTRDSQGGAVFTW
jgi:hypothetical protein